MKNLFNPKHFAIVLVCFSLSCKSDDTYVSLPAQSELDDRIVELYGSKAALILPAEPYHNRNASGKLWGLWRSGNSPPFPVFSRHMRLTSGQLMKWVVASLIGQP